MRAYTALHRTSGVGLDRQMTTRPDTSYPPAISVHEAARIFQVTPATAYAWVRNGEIPSIRLGGRIRIPVARLADLLGVTVEEISMRRPGPDDSVA